MRGNGNLRILRGDLTFELISGSPSTSMGGMDRDSLEIPVYWASAKPTTHHLHTLHLRGMTQSWVGGRGRDVRLWMWANRIKEDKIRKSSSCQSGLWNTEFSGLEGQLEEPVNLSGWGLSIFVSVHPALVKVWDIKLKVIKKKKSQRNHTTLFVHDSWIRKHFKTFSILLLMDCMRVVLGIQSRALKDLYHQVIMSTPWIEK